MKEEKLVWSIQENMYENRISLHCYKEATRGPFYGRYQGNRSLCGQMGVSEGGEEHCLPIDEIEPSILNEKIACKTCLKIYKKIEL